MDLKQRIVEIQDTISRLSTTIHGLETQLSDLKGKREKLGIELMPLLKEDKKREVAAYGRGKR